jgi:glycosyltransferase involved in cell wall biosynthesis
MKLENDLTQIEILMSSYNGERYIEEQIDTILNQENVKTHISIRDDGSSDGTVSIIKKLMQEYPGRISLYIGDNLGYRKSFLKLLGVARGAKFYGFADQDDYWLKDKCFRGVEELKRIDDEIALYATGVTLTDENLNVTGKTDSWNMPLTVESYFTRQRLAGCTYLFTEKVLELAKQYSSLNLSNEQMPDHDFVVGSIAFACGKVYLDKENRIYHRRHSGSVTSGGMGVMKRIQVEYGLVFKRPRVQSTMAKLLLSKCRDYIDNETIRFLKTVARCNDSLKNRMALIHYPGMTTGMKSCDFETRVKIITGNY